MEYAVLQVKKNDYLIIEEIEWIKFNNVKKELSKGEQKKHTYTLGGRSFDYKAVSKIKHEITSRYYNIYGLMPEIVLKFGDYRALTHDIFDYLEATPKRRYDFIEYFAKDFTNTVFKKSDYDFPFEAASKYQFLNLFAEDQISKFDNNIYMMLVEIALKARYDENNATIDAILNDSRFELPKDFDILYSDEMEFDEDLKFIKDKEIIKKYFLNNPGGLYRFLIHENVYTPEITAVLIEINPTIYTIKEKIQETSFIELFRNNPDIKAMGYYDISLASSYLSLSITDAYNKIIELDFDEVHKDNTAIQRAADEYKRLSEMLLDGIVNVPKLFTIKLINNILFSFSNSIKCPSVRNLSIDMINSFVCKIDEMAIDDKLKSEIFNSWFEKIKVNHSKILELIDENTKYIINKY